MNGGICPEVMRGHVEENDLLSCRDCTDRVDNEESFRNSDEVIKKAMPVVKRNRKEWGLDGLVGTLEAIVINVEENRYKPAVKELMDFTGLKLVQSMKDPGLERAVLRVEGSADFLIQHRNGESPFKDLNLAPKSKHLPNTRLETYIFRTNDIEKYVEKQKRRGVRFMTEEIIHLDNYSFIQTVPSSMTGNSLGFIQWKGDKGNYLDDGFEGTELGLVKRDDYYLKNINYLDHTATRLEAVDRDAAIIEFMELTNYDFDFAIHVKVFNSITNVARISKDDYAQVFTTGISPFKDLESSGPTEKFVYNYGKRTHHMAFQTEKIDDTFQGLYNDGMRFLIELVGSPDEGLKQTFTKQSPNTLLVNEYIHRYGDFDGFFTRSNVTDLTRATDEQ